MERDREIDRLRDRRDTALQERNRIVALLARLYPSGISQGRSDEGGDGQTRCVLIDLPTGQISWHVADDDLHCFDGLPVYLGKFDGHCQEEKYRRLEQWIKLLDGGESACSWRSFSARAAEHVGGHAAPSKRASVSHAGLNR